MEGVRCYVYSTSYAFVHCMLNVEHYKSITWSLSDVGVGVDEAEDSMWGNGPTLQDLS